MKKAQAQAKAQIASAPVQEQVLLSETEKKKRGRKKTEPQPQLQTESNVVIQVTHPVVSEAQPAQITETNPKKSRSKSKQIPPPTVAQATETLTPTLTETETPIITTTTPQKKKRTTKKSTESESAAASIAIEPETVESTPTAAKETNDVIPAPVSFSVMPVVSTHKKRGRKPKGGKLIQNLVNDNATINETPNIILHLKCSASDIPANELASDNFKPGDVVSFNALDTKGADLNDSYQPTTNASNANTQNNNVSKPMHDGLVANNSYNYLNDNAYAANDDDDDDDASGNDGSLKDIWKKLNNLKMCFHKSDVFQNVGAATRRSCCFWDTCEFDTPPVYLPKSISNSGGYSVYGCFCSPECALAYLMNEGIDTSVKFERCQLLNAMYGKLLNYEKSIKPAPNPQYILSKFYGNLSIQEYRKLFKSEQIVYVVNKPLTHILPEMYEENNDFMLNNKVIPNNNYKLKKRTSVFG